MHKPYSYLQQHKVNIVINKINEFNSMIIKQQKLSVRPTQTAAILHITNLFKFFKIQLPKCSGFIDTNKFKNKEF